MRARRCLGISFWITSNTALGMFSCRPYYDRARSLIVGFNIG